MCSKTEKATISHKKQVKNESVTSSHKWVSPLVCVPRKNGNICLRVDMCKADTAIIKNYYPIPTSDQILYEVNGAKIFSLNLTYRKTIINLFFLKNQETLQLLVLLEDHFDTSAYFLTPKSRFNIPKKLSRQTTTMTTVCSVCSTLVIILLSMQQIKTNICQSFEKSLTSKTREKGLKLNF